MSPRMRVAVLLNVACAIHVHRIAALRADTLRIVDDQPVIRQGSTAPLRPRADVMSTPRPSRTANRSVRPRRGPGHPLAARIRVERSQMTRPARSLDNQEFVTPARMFRDLRADGSLQSQRPLLSVSEELRLIKVGHYSSS